jgi:acetoacetyl-CoA synthetase
MQNTPIWQAGPDQNTQMDNYLHFLKIHYDLTFSDYYRLHAWSIAHLELFWQSLVEFFSIDFQSPAKAVMSDAHNWWETRWFEGATLNFAEHILRQHQGLAILAFNEQAQTQSLDFAELRRKVAYYAHILRLKGIQKGDRVVAVLPNIPETIIAMLATASIGAVWASCSPDFGDMALIDRFSQIEPKCIFAIKNHVYAGKCFSNIEKMTHLQEAIPSLKNLIWVDAMEISDDAFPLAFERVDFNHPLCILFSSGTTGKPKCMVHRSGGVLLQHFKELALHSNLQAQDRLLFYTTCGWMMWNWMLSALGLGTSLILYDGSPMYPQPTRLLEVLSESKTTVWGSSAAFFASLEKKHFHYDAKKLAHLRLILSTGSPLLPAQYDFIQNLLERKIQISSISGGSDIISCFALGHPQLPVYRGELQCLGLGMAVDVFDEFGQPTLKQGELVCKKPFPSMPIGFWNDENFQKYQEAYFEKYPQVWAHGDFAELTQHGGLIIYGRSDATLNPNGVRFGTAELYQVVLQVPGIVDCIAVSQDWQNDTRVILFVQLDEKTHWGPAIEMQLIAQIRQQLSPRHVPGKILAVRGIPKTINGKVMETAVRKLIHGKTLDNLAMIVNPECLEDYIYREELRVD